MAAPSKIKTWVQYNTFINAGDGPTPQAGQSQSFSDGRLAMFRIKEQFLDADWEVVLSCGYYDAGGGAAWNYGSADHWPTADSVRWKAADNTYSWIVVKNTALHNVGSGFQVCIALTNDRADTKILTLAFACEGGFSGGSSTSRPTATDEVVVLNNALWYAFSNLGMENLGLNIFYTTDGTSFRVHGTSNHVNGYNIHCFMFERLLPGYASWMDKPVIAGVCEWKATSLFDSSPPTIERQLFFSYKNIYKNSCQFIAEGEYLYGYLGDNAAVQLADPGGNWPCFPVCVASKSAVVPGYLGKIADAWGVPAALTGGNYMPGDGSMKFVVIDGLLVPCDGTSIVYP